MRKLEHMRQEEDGLWSASWEESKGWGPFKKTQLFYAVGFNKIWSYPINGKRVNRDTENWLQSIWDQKHLCISVGITDQQVVKGLLCESVVITFGDGMWRLESRMGEITEVMCQAKHWDEFMSLCMEYSDYVPE